MGGEFSELRLRITRLELCPLLACRMESTQAVEGEKETERGLVHLLRVFKYSVFVFVKHC